jgi:hypothetical protein
MGEMICKLSKHFLRRVFNGLRAVVCAGGLTSIGFERNWVEHRTPVLALFYALLARDSDNEEYDG